ncbi:MAG: FAD-binding oxidoreductase [Achromobacter sp.]|uniref:FAD-binding oxidoreductase n=1 Tax=Achromobacter sp. TaxID=134375 RepID=UPI0029A7B705|nr:FAD-binding oxidoreductase [Achromobacter sp.]MDX3985730.1 FAD-binding oxidoreductase [Achromobacter sp.]
MSIEERYLHDWTGTRYGTPVSVFRPRKVDDVSAWLRGHHATSAAVAVQGGRTGVSGGAAPGDGEHVLSLEDFNQVVTFDRKAGVIVVEAGMILAELQAIVEAEGWSFPLDLGSRGSCQLGGNAATNAGGCRVIKYGNTRNLVLGLEAVMADGSVLGPANTLVKNNAGYSLTQLLLGSEGTLGVISKLALRLVPAPAVRMTALLALSSEVAIADVLRYCRVGFGDKLSAFEVMWPEYVAAAIAVNTASRTLPESFSVARAVLVELEGDDELALTALLESVLSQAWEEGMVHEVVLSGSVKDAQSLWAIRESVGEIQARIRPYAGFDLGMPVSDYDAFVRTARANLAAEGLPVNAYFFGHAGDGNMHACIGPCHSDEVRLRVEAALYSLLPDYRSTVTAEHGVGRKKKAMLARARSPADLAVMKAIKQALDPKNILNPGRIFDL